MGHHPFKMALCQIWLHHTTAGMDLQWENSVFYRYLSLFIAEEVLGFVDEAAAFLLFFGLDRSVEEFENYLLFGREVAGRLDRNFDVLVAPAGVVQMLDVLAPQLEFFAREAAVYAQHLVIILFLRHSHTLP